MSSHYLYVSCQNCNKTESVYTGDITTYDFDDEDWEGAFVSVPLCISCKELPEILLNQQSDGDTNLPMSDLTNKES